eukprot:11813639-Ditylum_brightwellii.AAC.1
MTKGAPGNMEVILEPSRKTHVFFGDEHIGLQGQEVRLKQILPISKLTLSLMFAHKDASVQDKTFRTSTQMLGHRLKNVVTTDSVGLKLE